MITKRAKITAATALLLILSIILPGITPITMFSAGVSAETVTSRINFGAETITLSGGTSGGTVKYMYSPNANPGLDAKNYTTAGEIKRLASEKWYPVYGDSINISKFIPRSGEVVFAFRDADELPNSDGVYVSRVTSDIVPARLNIPQATLRNNIKYETSPTERVRISGELLDGYEYKVDLSQWMAGEDAFINVSPKYNALGGVVSIRKKATASTFASAEFKIKIPKAPAVPKLKVNNSKIIGIKIKDHRWSTSENGEYRAFTYTSIELNHFANQMGESVNEFTVVRENGIDYIAIFIKIAATDKKPSSPVQRLLIPRSSVVQQSSNENNQS